MISVRFSSRDIFGSECCFAPHAQWHRAAEPDMFDFRDHAKDWDSAIWAETMLKRLSVRNYSYILCIFGESALLRLLGSRVMATFV